MELPKRDPHCALRMPVLDKIKNRGIIIFSKVESGTVELGQKLILMPNGYNCQVVNIYNAKD